MASSSVVRSTSFLRGWNVRAPPSSHALVGGDGVCRGVVSSQRSSSSTAEFFKSASTTESELEKFRKVRWWDREGECKALHYMNPLRCRFIRDACSKHFAEGTPLPLRQKNVLDVGCGGGLLSESLGRLGGHVMGIDVVQRNIQTAQDHVRHDPLLSQTVMYACVSAEELLEQRVQFDLVVASEVIEHVKDPAAFLQTLSGLMQPNGILCITTLNRTLLSLVGAVWMAEYALKMVPRGTHEWRAFLTPAELSIAGRKAGLKMDLLCGMRLSPFGHRWTFSSDTSINYAAAFVRQSTPKGKGEGTEPGEDLKVAVPESLRD